MKQEIMKCSACGENRGEYFKYDPVTRTTYCVTCRNKTIVQNSVDDVDKLMEAIKQNGLDNSEGYAKLAAMCQEQIDKTGETILKLETVIGFVGDVREELKELRSEVKMQGEEIKSHGVKIDKLLTKSKQEVENLRVQLRAALSEKYISGEKVKDSAKELLKKSADDFLANFCEVVYSDDPQRLNAFLDSIDSSKDIADVELIIEFLLNDLQSENVTSLKNLVLKLNLKSKYLDRVEDEAEKVDDGIYDPILKRDIFIAFAGADESRVVPIVNELEEQGFECYFSLRNLRHGKDAKEVYWENLHTALSNCKCVVFCSSDNSRTTKCDAMLELNYVHNELNKKYNMGIAMYELILDEYSDKTKKLIKDTLKEYFDRKTYYDLDHVYDLCKAVFNYIQERDVQAIASTLVAAPTPAPQEKKTQTKAATVSTKQEEPKKSTATVAKTTTATPKNVTVATSAQKANAAKPTAAKPIVAAQTIETATSKPTLENYDRNEFEIVGTELKKYKGNKANVIVPDGVTSIGEAAFYQCSSMKSIKIPSSVTSIGEGAFSWCMSLISIEIPSSVTSIGDYAFSYCSSMTIINIPNSVTSIGENAFSSCSSMKSIKIPSSVTSIGDRAFWDCSSLTSIEIPSRVTSIGEKAFYDCSSLTSIKIPSSVTNISGSAFSRCSSITSIEIPSSVTSIGDHAFSYCSSLTSIEIPSSVTSIGNGTFYGCISITSIEIPSSVTSIGNDAFYKCSSMTSIKIPSSLTSIGSYAFYQCSLLTNIEIPSSVTSIGDRAFWDCSSLTSIEIPSSVTSIGELAFANCHSLTSIVIPCSVTSIGVGVFRCSSLTSIEIPSDVTSIGNYAFSSCSSLTRIEIPSSVTSIGKSVFYGCSSLITINFGGTKKAWKKINHNSEWKQKGRTIYCSDGKIKCLF